MRVAIAFLYAFVILLHGCDRASCRTESHYEGGVLVTETKICQDTSIVAYRSFYHNGALRQEKEIRNGMTHGEVVTYDSLGRRSWKGTYEQDTLNGPYEDYYASGTIRTKAAFLKGHQDGSFVEFYEDGTVQRQLEYDNGMKVGEFLEYYPNGALMMRAHFDLGFTMAYEEYDSLGNVIGSKRALD